MIGVYAVIFLWFLLPILVGALVFFLPLLHKRDSKWELPLPQLRQLQQEVRQKLLDIPPEEMKEFDLCAYELQLVEKYHISSDSELGRDILRLSGFLNHKGSLIYLQLLPRMKDDPTSFVDRVMIREQDDPFIIHLASEYKIRPLDACLIFHHVAHIILCTRQELLQREADEADYPELLNDSHWVRLPEERQRLVHEFITESLEDGTLFPIWNWGRRIDEQSGSAARIAEKLHIRKGVYG